MNRFSTKKDFSSKGQGALEYLLLIGGAVLIATIVLMVILGTASSTDSLINDNLAIYNSQITLGGGGGPSSLCVGGSPNNTFPEGSEQCDTDVGASTCALVLGAGYTGTLTCNNLCRFDTSQCVPPVGSDATPPTFVSFLASAPNSIGGTVRVNLDWTVNDATLPVQYAGATPGLAMEEGGSASLTTQMNTTANFNSQTLNLSINYLAPPSTIANGPDSYSHLDNTMDDDGLLVGQLSCYNMMYCDSVSTPNCEVQPAVGIVCSTPWQAKLTEAESFSSAGSAVLLNPTYSDGLGEVQSVVFDDPALASGPSLNVATYTNDYTLSDAAPGTVYRLWLRVTTTDPVQQVPGVRITGGNAFSVRVPAGTTDFTWRQSLATATIDETAGPISYQLTIPYGSTGASVFVDKILFTSNLGCTPVGDGSNCV